MKGKKVSKYRYERDFDFSEYMQDAWPEHCRRIVEARRAAPFVRVYYPLIGFLFSSVFAGGLSLIATVISKQESLWKVGDDTKNAWLYGVIQTAVPIMWVAAVVVVLIVVMACVSAGISKARELIFEAEKLEMASRMEYYFGEKLTAAASPEHRSSSPTFGEGAYPVGEIPPE